MGLVRGVLDFALKNVVANQANENLLLKKLGTQSVRKGPHVRCNGMKRRGRCVWHMTVASKQVITWRLMIPKVHRQAH
jgi:hypothetical protein